MFRRLIGVGLRGQLNVDGRVIELLVLNGLSMVEFVASRVVVEELEAQTVSTHAELDRTPGLGRRRARSRTRPLPSSFRPAAFWRRFGPRPTRSVTRSSVTKARYQDSLPTDRRDQAPLGSLEHIGVRGDGTKGVPAILGADEGKGLTSHCAGLYLHAPSSFGTRPSAH